jgi:type VI protein secretion system component Hcp
MQYLLRFFYRPNAPMPPSGSANGWMPVTSWGWGSSRQIRNISIWRDSDGASSSLMSMCLRGDTIPIAILKGAQDDGTGVFTFNLVNATIDSFQNHDNTEGMTISFEKVAYNTLGNAPDTTHSTQNTDYGDDDDDD